MVDRPDGDFAASPHRHGNYEHRDEAFLSDAEFLRPIRDLVILRQADQFGLLWGTFRLVVSQSILLPDITSCSAQG